MVEKLKYWNIENILWLVLIPQTKLKTYHFPLIDPHIEPGSVGSLLFVWTSRILLTLLSHSTCWKRRSKVKVGRADVPLHPSPTSPGGESDKTDEDAPGDQSTFSLSSCQTWFLLSEDLSRSSVHPRTLRASQDLLWNQALEEENSIYHQTKTV